MMPSRFVCASLLVGPACFEPAWRAPGDAPPSADAGVPQRITLLATGAELVRYRDGDGAWAIPEATGPDEYGLDVTGHYQVLVACSNGDGVSAHLAGRTVDDGAVFHDFCLHGVEDDAPAVAVTGTVAQPGTVWLHERAESTEAPWTFELAVPLGTHDLFAFTSSHVAFRRALAITAPTTIEPIDIVTEGVALLATPLTLVGAVPGEEVATSTTLIGEHGGAVLSRPGTTAFAVPPSALRAGELQFVVASAVGASTLRTVTDTQPERGFELELLPVLTDVTFADVDGRVLARWGELPAAERLGRLDFVVSTGTGSTGSSQRVSATRAWIETTGASALTFDANAPGYDPAWSIDPAQDHTRSFAAIVFGFPRAYTTEVHERVEGGRARGAAEDAWSARACDHSPPETVAAPR